MSILYNEYMSSEERELEILLTESEVVATKLDLLFESVDVTLEANMLAAEAKVLRENGTYEDLTMLYKEAAEEANAKKKGLIASLFEAIGQAIRSLGEWIMGVFDKNMDKEIDENVGPNGVQVEKEVIDAATQISTIMKDLETIQQAADGEDVAGAVAAIPVVTKWYDFFKTHKKGTIVAGAATAAAAGGVTMAIVKKDKLKEMINTAKGFIPKANKLIDRLKKWFETKFKKETPAVPAQIEASAENQTNESTMVQESETAVVPVNTQNKSESNVSFFEKIIRALQKVIGWVGNWLGKLKKAIPTSKKGKGVKVQKGKNGEPDTIVTTNYKEVNESVSLFGIDLDDEVVQESAEEDLSETEITELGELLADL